MLDKKDLLKLMKTVAKANKTAPTSFSWNDEKYSYSEMNEALRNELNVYCADIHEYDMNKHMIFKLVEEVMDDVLPRKVQDAYQMFAEVKNYGNDETPIFRRKITSGRTRALQFVTRVGLAGRYEVWKMAGSESFEVPTSAIGTAVQVGFEEFLDGRVDFAEMLDIVMEGMDLLIYGEVAKALTGAIGQLPAANKIATPGFDEKGFDRLIAIAKAYGEATIYTTYDFACKMIPDHQWMYTDGMKEELWSNGHFTNYKGTKVIILPNTFVDETNTTRVLDTAYTYIIPSGVDNKPVKIAFQGGAHVREIESNEDWSRELQMYRKVGVVALMNNGICVYQDTDTASYPIYGQQMGGVNP